MLVRRIYGWRNVFSGLRCVNAISIPYALEEPIYGCHFVGLFHKM